MSRAARAVDSTLPPGRAARVFLTIAFIDAAGRGLFMAGSALFYTQNVGLSSVQVGTGLSLAALCGLVCAMPIGRLADKIGDRRTLIILQVWRAVGFLVYPLVSDFDMFIVVACYIGCVEIAVGPIIQSMASSVADGDSLVRTMAFVAVVRNVAYSLSALVATLVIAVATPSVYVHFVHANAVAFVFTVLLLIPLRLPARAPTSKSHLVVRRIPLADHRFVAVSLANGILYLHVILLSVVLPLWIINRTSAPTFMVGVTLLINTVMAVTLQVRLSRGTDDMTQAGRRLLWAGAAMAAFCGLAAVSGSVGPLPAALLLVLAIGALTLGEIWQSAGAWGVSYGLSPPAQRAYYLSAFNLGATGIATIGPGILTLAVVQGGTMGWLGLAVVLVVAGVSVPNLVRRAGPPAPGLAPS